MHWNYRVIRRVTPVPGDEPGEVEMEEDFTIREVYYNDRDENPQPAIHGIQPVTYGGDAVVAWATEPSYPLGNTVDELRDDLTRMLEALGRPVIDVETLPGYEKKGVS